LEFKVPQIIKEAENENSSISVEYVDICHDCLKKIAGSQEQIKITTETVKLK
jgi:hypothetical protein